LLFCLLSFSRFLPLRYSFSFLLASNYKTLVCLFISAIVLWVFLILCLNSSSVHGVAQLVEALCHKAEGRGFDSRWRYCNFSLI
jgi:hypothetical protein